MSMTEKEYKDAEVVYQRNCNNFWNDVNHDLAVATGILVCVAVGILILVFIYGVTQ